MADPDVILYLYPDELDRGAFHTISMPQNAHRLVPPRRDNVSHEPSGRVDGEPTDQLHEGGDVAERSGLAIRFSDGAVSPLGVLAGCADNADLALPQQDGISWSHFAFTFDDQNRPIVRDLGSSYGTRVFYSGENTPPRSNFDWLLQRPGIPNGDHRPLVLDVANVVRFQVVVPPHDTTSPDYIARVTRFREGTSDPASLYASPGFRYSPSPPGVVQPVNTPQPVSVIFQVTTPLAPSPDSGFGEGDEGGLGPR